MVETQFAALLFFPVAFPATLGQKWSDKLGMRSSFTAEQMPEVIGTLMGMSDINRFSHVVMEDSAVKAPFGMEWLKAWALRLFGKELEVTRRIPLQPGRALALARGRSSRRAPGAA